MPNRLALVGAVFEVWRRTWVVVYGHAIHVTEPEIELMRRRRVSVTSHPSCNFHMRNGITPVVPLRAAGVNVAMGLDDNRRTMCRI